MNLLETETIEDRERWFRELVMEYDLTLKMGENRLLNFLDFWTKEKTYKKGTVRERQMMLFEIREEESAFDIRKRMAYWKRNNPEKPETIKGEKFPDYWSTHYDKKLGDMNLQQAYRKHLRDNHGYKFTYYPGAGEVVTPPK